MDKMQYLDFEKGVRSLDEQIAVLGESRVLADIEKARRLQVRRDAELRSVYSGLSPWNVVEVARHPDRPHALDYIAGMVENFVELKGDRAFADDQAIVGGLGRISGRGVVVIGEEKGSDTESRVRHNFGAVKPEGYRKAVRLMRLAEKFGLPVVSLIDTAGAFPGVESEQRNISGAIAESIQASLDLSVPSVAVVIGEGGSGGAMAIAAASRVLMLEYSVYSVVSPEGCASILWKDANHKKDAAKALKLTAADLLGMGVIDAVIEEPAGGAHRGREETVRRVREVVSIELKALSKFSRAQIRDSRVDKFERMTRLAK
ncbi:MAG: acetyl-CoA carboxylase carboxyltransferase subunit alpha [Rickettsiales bacterium]|jgi:acetyl-CoA carboxylase carboxyl transferase subunit alpha|nr:acetyl-CoA carboxylase carboxyltransferase subunit alpha [Rickettsiales bacterium]